MGLAKDKELLDHGWRHFQFHAQQRLSLFNFYVVLCGLLVAAWATVMTSDEAMGVVGILLSALLSFFSYIFWRLDQRNSYLTKEAEGVIGTAENRLFGEESKLFCAEKMDAPLGKARHVVTKSWSFGTSLGVIFLVVGLIGLAGAVFSGMTASERKPAITPKSPSKGNPDQAISCAATPKTRSRTGDGTLGCRPLW